MKIINLSNLRVYILFPKLRKVYEDLFIGGRKGIALEFDTGFQYLSPNNEMGGWFELTVLGFGLGFYWDFIGKEEEW